MCTCIIVFDFNTRLLHLNCIVVGDAVWVKLDLVVARRRQRNTNIPHSDGENTFF